MSFETITIYRDLPIKNGYVQVPPNRPTDKTRVTSNNSTNLVTNSQIIRLSLGSGKCTGSHFGQQEFLRLPGINPNTWYSTDPVDQLNS